jgi:hypothetical protein
MEHCQNQTHKPKPSIKKSMRNRTFRESPHDPPISFIGPIIEGRSLKGWRVAVPSIVGWVPIFFLYF